MKAQDCDFPLLIEGSKQFVIPVFQRDYSWSDEQLETLWDDVWRIGASSQGDERRHFFGAVVLVSAPGGGAALSRWLVVDGQQRLTTLTLLLAALRDSLEQSTPPAQPPISAQQVAGRFLVNEYLSEHKRRKLLLRRRDDATLESIVLGRRLPAEPSPRIRHAYEWFRRRVGDADSPERIHRGITRLRIVEVILRRAVGDDVQAIFESLNSTGLALAESDQIRNFVLMGLDVSQQTELYRNHWEPLERAFGRDSGHQSQFFRDYVGLRRRVTQQIRLDRTYPEFRKLWSEIQCEDRDVEGAVRTLRNTAERYAAFRLGYGSDAPETQKRLARIRRLYVTPANLITRLLEFQDAGHLSEPGLHACLDLIESYLFRRMICGWQTRSYWSVFARMARDLDPQRARESLAVGMSASSYDFPSDSAVRDALTTRQLDGLYGCRFLLESLEKRGWKESASTDNLQVEHIMPRHLSSRWKQDLGDDAEEIHDVWIGRLGNLTLTGYNPEYSNRSFAEKLTMGNGFQDSPLRLNQYIKHQQRWGVTAMRNRGERLADRALKIWRPLQVKLQWRLDVMRQQKTRRAADRGVQHAISAMDRTTRGLFGQIRSGLLSLSPAAGIIELSERKGQISYHAPGFFLEVLARRAHVTLLLPIGHHHLSDLSLIVEDGSDRKFVVGSNYFWKCDGKTIISLWDSDHVESALVAASRALDLTGRRTPL